MIITCKLQAVLFGSVSICNDEQYVGHWLFDFWLQFVQSIIRHSYYLNKLTVYPLQKNQIK